METGWLLMKPKKNLRNGIKTFKKYWKRTVLTPVELPCPMPPEQETAIGLYLNYLHVGNLVVVPQFKLPEDKKAIDKIREIFGVRKQSGGLRCPLDSRTWWRI
jgi:agmatine/peptidylarginine deiminase